jgi:hypothetical protein
MNGPTTYHAPLVIADNALLNRRRRRGETPVPGASGVVDAPAGTVIVMASGVRPMHLFAVRPICLPEAGTYACWWGLGCPEGE